MTNQTYESIINIQNNNDPVLFLFHGTGADYRDLISIAQHLNPNASYVSVNGNVFTDGMRRYFDRTPAGIDLLDLENRSLELASYLNEIIADHNLLERKKVAIGYSNGANIIIGMLQTSAKLFDGVGLLHGRPYLQAEVKDAKDLTAFVSVGENDTMIDPAFTLKLVKELDEKGAHVTVYTHQFGHRLTTDELDALKSWYQGI